MAPQLVRFVIVGVAAAALLFSLTLALNRFGMPPFAAGAAAYAVAFAFAYTLQRGWTIGGGHAHKRALPRYFIVQVGCALASGATSHVVLTVLGWPLWLSSAAVTVAASAISFVLTSRWVFPPPATDGDRV
jgi:putative flippase GtrA